MDDWVNYFSFNGLDYPYSIQQSLGGPTEEIGADYRGLIEGAYKSNGPVFACMMVRQLLFQEARFQFRRLQSGRPGEYFGSRDLAPLEEPWPNATTGDLLARAIQDVDLAGNWYGVRLGDEIRRLRPDYVTIVMGSKLAPQQAHTAPDVEILGYVYEAPSSKPVFYLREQIAHFAPYPDPSAQFRGMSWLTPIIREIMGDQAATTHKLKFFEQGATPNMVVSFDPAIDSDKVATWIELMEDQVGGAANAYRTLYMGGGASADVVGSNMKDIGFKDVQGAGETRIAAAAGVPPVIVGLSEGLQAATYSNYSQARRRFADGTMRPLWRNFCGSVASIIRVPRGAMLYYDDRDIPFLQEDAQDQANIMQTEAATLQSLVAAGYTPDSAKESVLAGDLGRLEHSGLVSVQLLPPGTEKSPAKADPMPPKRESRAADANPPGEAEIRTLVGRYSAVEAEVRELLRNAVRDGREHSLGKAMEALDTLRQEKPEQALVAAYSDALDNAVAVIEEKAATRDPVEPLIESLDKKLGDAITQVEDNAQEAFRSVDKDNVAEKEDQAVTAFTDEAGRNWALSSYAGTQIRTLGRRATSRGIKDGVGAGVVEVSSHGTQHPECQRLEGKRFPAASAPEPPYHENCQHMLVPISG
jgi:phage portal protein BeeE